MTTDNRAKEPVERRREIIVAIRSPLRRLDDKLAAGADWLDAEEIVRALESEMAEPLPERFRQHLLSRLDGSARKKRGPKSTTGVIKREMVIWVRYYGLLERLQRRKRTVGLEGWPRIRHADWWKGPPAERAARMVREKLAPTLTWKQVQEIAQRVQRELGDSRTQQRSKSVRSRTPKASRR